jgi:hypothetical protein
MNQKKAFSIITVVAVGVVIIIVGLLLSQRDPSFVESPTQSLVARNFEFDYDQNIFEKENYVCQISVSETTNITDSKAIRLKHSFAFPWTDGRGDKHTELTDISVSFCLVEGNYKELASYYYGTPTATTVNGRPTQKIEMGAEGAGANEYYIWMDDNTTLVVSHGYVTPFFDSALSEDTRYIPMNQQEHLLKNILTSLAFK